MARASSAELRLKTYEAAISLRLGERVHFSAISDIATLRNRFAKEIFGQATKECAALGLLDDDAMFAEFTTRLCEYIRFYLPLFAACRVREVVFRAHTGEPLDHAFLKRHVATCLLRDGTLEAPSELDRVAASVLVNNTPESEAASAFGSPLQELVQAIFIQDDDLFALLWPPFSKWVSHRTRVHGHTSVLSVRSEDEDAGGVYTAAHVLTLLANVCAHHGTHSMTLQVATYYARSGFDAAEARFIDFVSCYGATPAEHLRLSRGLFRLGLVTPGAVLQRSMAMVPNTAAQSMVAVLLSCSVDFKRKLSNRTRGMAFHEWTKNHTASPLLSTLANRDHLVTLGHMWTVAITRKGYRRFTPDDGCFLCFAVSLQCGALLHIGLRLLELDREAHTPVETQAHVHATADTWRLACSQSDAQVRGYVLAQMWAQCGAPHEHIATVRRLRGNLPDNVFGTLLHYRCYGSMAAFSAYKELPAGTMLPVVLCRVALADRSVAQLCTLLTGCMAPVTRAPFLDRAWMPEIARVYMRREQDMAALYAQLLPCVDARPLDIFQDALHAGLPDLAAIAFSGDRADVLGAHCEAAIAPRCYAFCTGLEPTADISTDALCAALGDDDVERMARIVRVAPWLVAQAPNADTWLALKRAHRPWCTKRRSRDAYRTCPANMLVAAVRLRRTACIQWFLGEPALIRRLEPDRWGHSVFCEAAWLNLNDVCEQLYRSGAVALGACERVCCPGAKTFEPNNTQ